MILFRRPTVQTTLKKYKQRCALWVQVITDPLIICSVQIQPWRLHISVFILVFQLNSLDPINTREGFDLCAR